MQLTGFSFGATYLVGVLSGLLLVIFIDPKKIRKQLQKKFHITPLFSVVKVKQQEEAVEITKEDEAEGELAQRGASLSREFKTLSDIDEVEFMEGTDPALWAERCDLIQAEIGEWLEHIKRFPSEYPGGENTLLRSYLSKLSSTLNEIKVEIFDEEPGLLCVARSIVSHELSLAQTKEYQGDAAIRIKQDLGITEE
jgi:hypothetical protein